MRLELGGELTPFPILLFMSYLASMCLSISALMTILSKQLLVHPLLWLLVSHAPRLILANYYSLLSLLLMQKKLIYRMIVDTGL